MSSNKKNTFLMSTIILGVAGIIIKILGAVFRIPLGNMIGEDGMGYYQASYSVFALFLTLATAGFPTAISKLVSEQVAIGNHKGANEIFKITHVMLLVTGVVMFTILFFGSGFIVNEVQHNPNSIYAMKAIAPALLIVPSMSAYRGYYQGYQQMTRIAVSQVIEQLFRAILGLILAYILMSKFGPKLGAAGGISGATIGALSSFLFLVFIYVKDSKKRNKMIKESVGYVKQETSTIIKKIIMTIIPISIGACMMPLVSVVDTIIVISRLKAGGYSYLAANALFGQLTGMAMSIIVMPMIFTTAIGISLVPAISTSFALKKYKEARHNAKLAFKITMLLVLPCAFGLAALAEPIMHLLYPKQPSEVIGLMLFALTPGCVFLGLLYTFNGVLQGIGKPMIPVFALLAGIFVKIIVSYILIPMPQFNILGSIIGTVLSYSIAAVIEYIYIKKHLGMRLNIMEYFIKPIITVMVMFVFAKLSYIVFSKVLGGNIATLLAIIVGGISYIIVLFMIGGINKSEILSMPKGHKIVGILQKLRLIK